MIYSPAKLWQQWILNMILEFLLWSFLYYFRDFSIPINVITSLFWSSSYSDDDFEEKHKTKRKVVKISFICKAHVRRKSSKMTIQ